MFTDTKKRFLSIPNENYNNLKHIRVARVCIFSDFVHSSAFAMTNLTAGFTGGWGVDAGFTKKSAFTQIELSLPPKMMFYRNSESRTTYPVILKLMISTPNLVPKGFPCIED